MHGTCFGIQQVEIRDKVKRGPIWRKLYSAEMSPWSSYSVFLPARSVAELRKMSFVHEMIICNLITSILERTRKKNIPPRDGSRGGTWEIRSTAAFQNVYKRYRNNARLVAAVVLAQLPVSMINLLKVQ